MKTRRAGLVLGVLAMVGGALAGCSAASASTGVGGPHAQTVGAAAPAVAAVSVQTSKSGSAAASSKGCAATKGGIPAGAKRKTTIDVDGDGKADIEWFTATTFGITTKSGATSTVKPSVSGGADPMALTGKLKGTSTVLVLIAGSRDVQTFRYLDCKIQPVVDKHKVQYRFDLTNQYGDGVGTEDSNGDGKDSLVGYKLSKPYGSLKPGQTVKIATTTINLSGLTASAGKTGTSTTALPGGKKTLDHATTVSIGSLNITHDGLTAPD